MDDNNALQNLIIDAGEYIWVVMYITSLASAKSVLRHQQTAQSLPSIVGGAPTETTTLVHSISILFYQWLLPVIKSMTLFYLS